MKHHLKPICSLLAFAFLDSVSVQAETREKIRIAIETDDFELAETDISTLAVGTTLAGKLKLK